MKHSYLSSTMHSARRRAALVPSRSKCDDQRRHHHIRDGQGEQEFPPESHQLVITETRQRAAHPNVNEEKNENFGDEPENGQERTQERWPNQRTAPAAEK